MRPVTSLPVRMVVALGVAAGTVLAAPAGADSTCYQLTPPDGPEFCTQQVWFTPGDSKVGNLAAAELSSFPSWSSDAPKESVAQGAGGGYATNGIPRQQSGESNPATGARFVGGFTGDIDNLDVTMYLFAPGRQNEPTYYGGIDVVVDGVTLLTIDINGLPLSSGGNAVLKTGFAVTNLHKAMIREQVETGPDVEHEVELFLTAYPLATATAVFVYGTTEVPSSMTFNVEDLGDRFVLPA